MTRREKLRVLLKMWWVYRNTTEKNTRFRYTYSGFCFWLHFNGYDMYDKKHHIIINALKQNIKDGQPTVWGHWWPKGEIKPRLKCIQRTIFRTILQKDSVE